MGRSLSGGSSSGGSIAGTIGINQGGTGQITAPAALAALGGLSASSLAAALNNTPITAGLNFVRSDKGTVSTGTVVIDRSLSAVYKVKVGGPITLSLAGFLANDYGDVLLELVNGGSAVVTMPVVNWILPTTGGVTTSFSTYLTATGRSPAALQTAGTDFILFWSDDAGVTVYGKLV